jgi:hypothetical protein
VVADPDNVDLVKRFLRGQNLEQVGRVDEAIALYETTIEGRFDSTGPYDRLIAIYSHRSEHKEVARVAEAALAQVRTHEEKRQWFARMRAEAEKTASTLPRAAPKRPPAG